jgi:hypothetical protein
VLAWIITFPAAALLAVSAYVLTRATLTSFADVSALPQWADLPPLAFCFLPAVIGCGLLTNVVRGIRRRDAVTTARSSGVG